MNAPPRLSSLKIEGYRPFGKFTASLAPLEVIVGANGSGKTSLFEFLRFLHDGMTQPIPPGIVPGYVGQQVFHVPGPQRFSWEAEFDGLGSAPLCYAGELTGPVGASSVVDERVFLAGTADRPEEYYLHAKDVQGFAREFSGEKPLVQHIGKGTNQLALGVISNLELRTLYQLRKQMARWTFYSSFGIVQDKLRRSIPVEQTPILNEDAGNLSSLLFYLKSEHPPIFEELQFHLRSAVPNFKSLAIKARGAPGEVIAFWREQAESTELTLADLSDGILRLLCWICLCIQPSPPALICIDEPELGLHPRTLPLLAGLFRSLSQRTQVLLATHSSYFLLQFGLEDLAVIRRDSGESVFLKPRDSAALIANLKDFGQSELEAMHRSDELEQLA